MLPPRLFLIHDISHDPKPWGVSKEVPHFCKSLPFLFFSKARNSCFRFSAAFYSILSFSFYVLFIELRLFGIIDLTLYHLENFSFHYFFFMSEDFVTRWNIFCRPLHFPLFHFKPTLFFFFFAFFPVGFSFLFLVTLSINIFESLSSRWWSW